MTNLFLEDRRYDVECEDGEWTCIELLNGKANLILKDSQDEYFQYIFVHFTQLCVLLFPPL